MLPQRIPLGAIDGNRLPYARLTPYIRGKIIGCILVGSKPTVIALGLNIGLDTPGLSINFPFRWFRFSLRT
jgi:hypothetical protein